ELRSRLSEVRSRIAVVDDGLRSSTVAERHDSAALRAELEAAGTAHQQAVQDCDQHRTVAEEAARLLADRGVRAARAKEKLEAAQSELALAVQRLAAQ
ncbi:MAG: hypothetical protein ACPHCN_17585, partial [Mycobacterium sp.]